MPVGLEKVYNLLSQSLAKLPLAELLKNFLGIKSRDLELAQQLSGGMLREIAVRANQPTISTIIVTC
jgi:hypothetical protein